MTRRVLTLRVGTDMFGLPLLDVLEVLSERVTLPVPLVPDEVAGLLAVRDDVVTAINLQSVLNGSGARDRIGGAGGDAVVVVDTEPQRIALVVDEIGDVVSVDDAMLTETPATAPLLVRELTAGAFLLEQNPVLLLDPHRVITLVLGLTKELAR